MVADTRHSSAYKYSWMVGEKMKPRSDKRDISLTFFTRYNIKQKEVGNEFFDLIYKMTPQIAPEKVDLGHIWHTFNERTVSRGLNKWGRSLTMLFRRESKFESELAILFEDVGNYKTISYWVEKEYFNNPTTSISFLGLSVEIYKLIHPEYGKIHLVSDSIKMATFDHPIYGETIYPVDLKKGLPGIYWVNFFGPNVVEKLGREKLLSIPCYKREEFDDGGLLLALSSQYEVTAGMKKQQQEIRNFLGEDNFYPQTSPFDI